MMNLEREMKTAAHYAAQKVALRQARDELRDRYWVREPSRLAVRRLALDTLVRFGFARCLLEESGELKPVSQGCRDWDGEAWVNWSIYRGAEIGEYHRCFGGSVTDLDRAGRYGGPGREFSANSVRRTVRRRVLVTQSGGLDI